MADIINMQELADAKLDAQSLERFINGGVDEEVLTRLSQQYPTMQNFLFQFQKYNSRAYKTYALMDADKASIPAKSKVTVTNDATTANNGDWQWDGTMFTKSIYDPLAQFNSSIKVSYPDLYEVAPKTSNMYVGAATLVTVTDGALVGFPIEINKTYLIKASAFMSANLRYVGLAAAGAAINGKAVTKRDLLPTSDPNIYKFSTTSADTAYTQAFFTTKLVSQSYDVRTTTSIFEGFVSQDLTPYVSRINNNTVAKPQNPLTISRFENLKVWAAGDSITEGTSYVDDVGATVPKNTYVEYLAKAFGTAIVNYGSSGATVARVVDIIAAGSGIDLRGGTVSYGAKDLTDLACFTLMIGTNDANLGLIAGSIDQLPNGKFDDYPTANDYAQLFPNNYLCNIALLIEYIRWKSPKCEIHIIAPPYRNRPAAAPNNDLPSKMINVIPYLESVCRHYGVHLIYAIYECGIGYKAMSPLPKKTYSYDGVHFTKLGNEVFGKFIAQKVLSFG